MLACLSTWTLILVLPTPVHVPSLHQFVYARQSQPLQNDAYTCVTRQRLGELRCLRWAGHVHWHDRTGCQQNIIPRRSIGLAIDRPGQFPSLKAGMRSVFRAIGELLEMVRCVVGTGESCCRAGPRRLTHRTMQGVAEEIIDSLGCDGSSSTGSTHHGTHSNTRLSNELGLL